MERSGRGIQQKVAAFAIAAALALAALSSCSAGIATQKGAEHEPLTVCNVNGLFTDSFVESFQEVHPEIRFEASAYSGANGSGYVRSTLQSGEIPDVFISTYLFSPEAQREQLIDLSGYGFINNYTATMLNESDNGGGIYLLPSSFQMAGICYNKTLMAEHGWEVPETFEELAALVPEIEAAGLTPMRCMFNLDGYPFNYFFNILNTEYFHTAGGAQWKEDFPAGEARAAGNEELLAGAEYFERWVDAGLIRAEDFDAANEPKQAFLNGECVFFMSLGLSEYRHMTEDGRVYEFGVMPWLSDDGETDSLTVTVSRYFGLSRRLLEPGNEQKLADALALLEYVSTPEGQAALVAHTAAPNLYAAPLTGSEIPVDSPFYELGYLVDAGHTVSLVYSGWEELIAPMAGDIKRLVAGEIDAEGLLEAFDATYDSVANEAGNVAGVLLEDLDMEQTERPVAIATGRAADADASLVSEGGYNALHEVNDKGVSWHLYAGDITTEEANMVRTKCYSISVLELTGAEVRALAEGGFDRHGSGCAFPYTLVTRGDAELADDAVYRLAVGTEDLAEEMRGRAVEVVDVGSQQAVLGYVTSLGTFGAEDIVWE